MKKNDPVLLAISVLILLGLLLVGYCLGFGTKANSVTTTTTTRPIGTHGLTNIFFLHQSVGQGLISDPPNNKPIMRSTIAAYNKSHGTNYKLWDFWGMGDGGLIEPNGKATNIDIYKSYFDYSQTDPESLYWTWTSNETKWVNIRNEIMKRFQVIAFKSCFSSATIEDADSLNLRQTWYLGMRDYFDQHPEKLFVVVTSPPQIPSQTTPTQAANARAFCNWLKSADYLSGHSNVVCFDLFDYLAQPDDGSANANTLKPFYRLADQNDSHPNSKANNYLGPIFANFLIKAAASY